MNSTITSTIDEKRFAIIGSHEGTFNEETEKLNEYDCLSQRSEIQKGTKALNEFIEEKISDHLEKQMPNA